MAKKAIAPSNPKYKKMTPAQRNANTVQSLKDSFGIKSGSSKPAAKRPVVKAAAPKPKAAPAKVKAPAKKVSADVVNMIKGSKFGTTGQTLNRISNAKKTATKAPVKKTTAAKKPASAPAKDTRLGSSMLGNEISKYKKTTKAPAAKKPAVKKPATKVTPAKLAAPKKTAPKTTATKAKPVATKAATETKATEVKAAETPKAEQKAAVEEMPEKLTAKTIDSLPKLTASEKVEMKAAEPAEKKSMLKRIFGRKNKMKKGGSVNTKK